MNQCVPSWDIDDPPNKDSATPHLLPRSSSVHPQLPMSHYEVAELTWENGQLSAHGLIKPTPRYPPPAAGTLECIVDQAKLLHNQFPSAAAASDALVPTQKHQREDLASGIGSCDIGNNNRKKARLDDYKATTATNCTSRDDTYGTNSVTAFGDDETGEGGTPGTENTSFGGGGGSRAMTVVDDHDSVCHSQRSLSQKRGMAGEEDDKVTEEGTMRSTISTKRSRAAAIHNQSERKRRDRINQKMRTLQKLVPNSSKTDKASMLDEVIDYMKQLKAQVQVMRGMGSVPPMMMPLGMQQFQMTMMAQMAQMAQISQMGMGMGMIDMTSLGRAGPTGISPVIPTPAFVPMIGGSWDPSVDRMQQPTGAIMPDPFSAFFGCPSQQMTLDTHQRMATLYQQMFHQTHPTNPK